MMPSPPLERGERNLSAKPFFSAEDPPLFFFFLSVEPKLALLPLPLAGWH